MVRKAYVIRIAKLANIPITQRHGWKRGMYLVEDDDEHGFWYDAGPFHRATMYRTKKEARDAFAARARGWDEIYCEIAHVSENGWDGDL